MDNEKITALRAAKEHREKEVLYHQINIDNYKLAIALIDAEWGDDDTLEPFRAQLEELLAASTLEQKKERILLEVITRQLNEG
ncbi:MAG: hypothetical protein IPI17_02290 [Nitrosomonas sp.]|jgi:hypothetical protein|nr:hypothetical protein [Nitrosomonas sp.]